PRPRQEPSPPPARQPLQGPQLPEAAPGITRFRSSPWQQPPPPQHRRRGREPEGATGLPGAPAPEGDPEEEDGGAAGQRICGRPGSSHNGSGDGGAAAPSARPRDFLYVGVMTAQKYLGSRALAAQRTWARFIPGRVEFFSSQQPPNAGPGQPPPPLPVIALPGVDDSYPPQKKSFMMIKYMHDHYLDKYEWFMRADDDVYIKGDKLEEFLRSLNSSKPLYLGQTGLGNIEELGKLGLEPGENFCMGGPGMIFSREVLRRMVPHIGECLREMYTTHEDVEVGRCVRRFGGTQCVWSYEVSLEL
ncbi:chondroitin sulfate synthase 3, partial [Carlito syrichta]|uniref:N-acetylgalactosaminyl-proteoglycan 3-beta-glucuronosyltransferase n=1 Tax=Carlito syrichta TaxID=1868482 RepID=A0A3Q0E9U7_CARSF